MKRSARLLFLSLALAPQVIFAQAPHVGMLDFATGSEYEDYLRALQLVGGAPQYPWSIRGFSAREIAALAASDSLGPWGLKNRLELGRPTASASVAEIFNSAYPYGANDGPVWAGRGLTSVVAGGIFARLGNVSLSFNPIAFSASNRPFPLRPNGHAGLLAFNNASYSNNIDYPQRFGDKAYSRVDPGGTFLRLDTHYVTAGVSTANEWMGPATEYPFLLGTNAPGFPHLFLGTGEPLGVFVGKIHFRLGWGRLYQSPYSPVTGPLHFVFQDNGQTGTARLTSSANLVFLPRGMPGLEIGAARFFHVPYSASEPSSDFWRKPWKIIFLRNEIARGDLGLDNQLASVFFRWAFAHSGFEVYGERGFEDHLYNPRDLFLDIDHEREYMLGFQKVVHSSPDRMDVLKGELVNFQEPTIARGRLEAGIYVHGTLRQGHTNRGQLLGANVGAGWAAGSVISWTRYSQAHRTAFTLRRIVRDANGTFQTTGIINPRSSDVLVASGIERTWMGDRLDWGGKIEAMQEFNRNFSSNVPNLNLQLTARIHGR